VELSAEHALVILARSVEVFYVEQFVLANLYGRLYTYLQMKRRTRVAKAGKIVRLKASAEKAKGSPDWMASIGKLYKPIKQPVTLRLDADVLAWFKKQGRGYQTRINRALRAVMMEGRKSWG
jgi:uncharacterized protein (DUF4415 family)